MIRTRAVLFLTLLLTGVSLAARAGDGGLTRSVAPAAGSAEAPVRISIGLHIEPLGTTMTARTTEAAGPDRSPGARSGGRHGGSGGGYRSAGLFTRHLADIRSLVALVERHRGRLVVQAQSPFTETLRESGDPLFRDLEAAGHEVALHFHEDAHLGRGCERLPVATWTGVMKAEIELLRDCGATRVRYWSGGNLYPGVLDAAAAAGLTVMSDYKNPRKQESHPSLIALHPWRPARGPSESDLTDFARHDPNGKIVYLPGGIFTRTNYAAARRSEETGGDWGYFDFLTESLEASLRAARSDRVNTFHITLHPGEFRGRGERPFAVVEEWLTRVVDPLVKAGKVRWATFSEMAQEYRDWERRNPGADPRAASAIPADADALATTVAAAPDPGRGTMTFAINVHDFCNVPSSADTLLRAIDLFVRNGVRGDFYLTGPIARKYAEERPDVIARLRETKMTISYHVRPPHPLCRGFDGRLQNLDDEALTRTLLDHESWEQDLRTGELVRGRPGGYRYVKELFGSAPVVVGAATSDPRLRAAALAVYRDLGAQMTVAYHESGTDPEQPFVFRHGLLERPSDFSITRWKTGSAGRENFWWNMLGGRTAANGDPTARLQQMLADWQGPRPPFVTALIHENNFYNRGPEAFTAIYWQEEDKSRPLQPPYDLTARGSWTRRPEAEQEQIWRAYESLVAYAAKHLQVATSEQIVEMARAAAQERQSGR